VMKLTVLRETHRNIHLSRETMAAFAMSRHDLRINLRRFCRPLRDRPGFQNGRIESNSGGNSMTGSRVANSRDNCSVRVQLRGTIAVVNELTVTLRSPLLNLRAPQRRIVECQTHRARSTHCKAQLSYLCGLITA